MHPKNEIINFTLNMRRFSRVCKKAFYFCCRHYSGTSKSAAYIIAINGQEAMSETSINGSVDARTLTFSISIDKVRIEEISIADIVVGERIRQDPTRGIEQLANSIQAVGLLHPIVVEESQNSYGKAVYVLLAGERRIEAFKHLNRTKIMAQILSRKEIGPAQGRQ
jgi:hypothetical protein